jgi:salicylate hydroxylase
VTLLGDACHPMLPFMAQGAAQALEDGAALTSCLTQREDRSIPESLLLYETVRKPRASRVQSLAEVNKTRFHLPDGAAQRERDEQMAGGGTDFSIKAVEWIYAHDASVLAPPESPLSALDHDPGYAMLDPTTPSVVRSPDSPRPGPRAD